MLGYIVRRLAGAIVVLILATIITFLMGELIPGDPARMMMGQMATEEMLDTVRAEWGLDKPLHVRFTKWLGAILLHGDFGRSPFYRTATSTLVAKMLPVTAELLVLSLLATVLVAVPLGLFAAFHAGTWIDRLIRRTAMLFSAVPDFIQATVLLLVFTVYLRILPASGYVDLWVDPAANLRLLILPIASIVIFFVAELSRYVRAVAIDVLLKQYITTARAKGISERKVKYKHVLRNSLIPLITILGVYITYGMGGVIIQETIFSLPGLGKLAMSAVMNRDFMVLRTIVLFTAMVAVVVNLLVDILYGVVDPRIRYD